MTAPELLIERIEMAGGVLSVNGDRIRYQLPGEAAHLLDALKSRKGEVLAVLKDRTIPPMPAGVQLVRWEPKPAPVAIDVCSIVVDVAKFVQSELSTLDSRLNNAWTIRGGFTIPQILDRLAQAGVVVALEERFDGWS